MKHIDFSNYVQVVYNHFFGSSITEKMQHICYDYTNHLIS